MQRQREQEEQQRLEKEEQRAITESHWRLEYKQETVATKESTNKAAVTRQRAAVIPTLLAFESSGFHGRQSYRQFNKEIEKLTQTTAKDQQTQREEEQEKRAGISDAQMTGWYSKQDEQKRGREGGTSRNRRERQNKRERTDETRTNNDDNVSSDRLGDRQSITKRRIIQQEPSSNGSSLLTPDTSAVDARGDGFLKPILSNNDDE
ncbi:hypothetical protein BDF22DRAFT_732829 [Syncephalis plumigaleata]|nr:hypothetical protein BDF22DRAFT_732829 [Syncephalis plumigaleata]